MSRPQAFGPYELIERVGVGALGEVYRARRSTDRRVVALKRISYSSAQRPGIKEALEDEAALNRRLDHPAISKVLEVGAVSGVPYIAYEYVHGRDLRALMERVQRGGAKVPVDVAIHVVLRVCEALAHAHTRSNGQRESAGMVHRDIKPQNILISMDGEVKLSDFGIACAEGAAKQKGGGYVKGTMGYMSPEQVRDDPVDGRSDIYSLGVCLWELVTGKRLFEGTAPRELMARVLRGGICPPCQAGALISPELEKIILKAIANSTDQRYRSVDEFHADLCELARAEGTLTDTSRVACFVRSVFPEVAADGAAVREECPDMADNKGGSDLDVFEGLAKKPTRPANPGLAPPPSHPQRMQTLLGGLGPLPPPSAPPGSGPSAPGSLPAPLPPPKAPGTMPGLPSSALPPPAPPPSRAPVSGGLPAPLPPPSRMPVPPSATPLPPPAVPPPSAAPLPPPKLPSAPPAPLPPPMTPPPAAVGVKPKKAVEMEWEDEDESTHVYDKQMHDVVPTGPRSGAPSSAKVSAAAALLASSGGAAPSVRAPVGPSAPPAPPPVPSSEPATSKSRRDHEETAIRPRPAMPAQAPAAGGSRAGVILGGLALVVVLALAVFMLLPKKGQFKINVAGKGGAPLAIAEIYIDGQKKCDTTPCVVTDLDPGSKSIKVIAPGTPPMTTTISETIEAGKEKVVFMTLDGAASAAGGVAAGVGATPSTELKIGATEGQKGIKVSIDGTDKGTLPLELKDLAPGSHKLVFNGGERYEKLEQSVEIAAGQSKDLGAIKLKVLKGQVTLELATSGAKVTLERRDGGKKVEKKLPDSLWKSPPVKIDVDPKEGWKLVATKKGYDDFVKDLSFDDGVAEKTLKIELFEEGKSAAATQGSTPSGPAPHSGGSTAAPEKPATSPATGNGTLNINSIPVSKVVLDGRPLGSTPKVGVSVSAGSHTVTFIHPEKGKRSVTVQVKPGETKTAAVRFK